MVYIKLIDVFINQLTMTLLELHTYAQQSQIASSSNGIVLVNCHVHLPIPGSATDISILCTGGPSVWLEIETHHQVSTVTTFSQYEVHLDTMNFQDHHDVLMKVELMPAESEKLLQFLVECTATYINAETGKSEAIRSIVVIQRPHLVTEVETKTPKSLHESHRISAARAIYMAHKWTRSGLQDTAKSVLVGVSNQLKNSLSRLDKDNAAKTLHLIEDLNSVKLKSTYKKVYKTSLYKAAAFDETKPHHFEEYLRPVGA
ncbi:hypothetical protein THRCLA_20303 [Thraustotheca clavata]|uniref:Uncharacterized protein n=1 Tax=Thraustotheca clavata TaxID=74557 RepID=A0A1W0A8V8_9STRA|nr:hypothetical protein THRCLA_20303 [Thraustotheca clavata]